MIGAPFGMDILCYTPEEFEGKLEEFGIVRSAVLEALSCTALRDPKPLILCVPAALRDEERVAAFHASQAVDALPVGRGL